MTLHSRNAALTDQDLATKEGGDHEPALRVQNLSFAYSRATKALDDVSFSIRKGRFSALVGPNGAGKTTLMALVTRLFSSAAGRIEVCGADLERNPREALAAMGVVFQRPTLDVDLSVRQNLAYACKLYGIAGALARTRIDSNLERLGLLERQHDTVRTLSGGMRRRVELARSLLHEPSLLILDEPTVGLDIDSRQGIVRHVHDLCAERRLAVLWTTHLIDEIRPGDDVIMLAAGKVRAHGTGEVVAALAGADDLAGAYRHFCIEAGPGAA